MFIFSFVNVGPGNVDIFFASRLPATEGRGKVGRLQSSGSPLPVLLKGEGEAGHLPLHLWEEEKFGWGEVW